MPASFVAKRPMTRQEYARRRDQTTQEEVEKLTQTQDYKRHATQRNLVVERRNMLIVSIALVSIVVGGMISLKTGSGTISVPEVQSNEVEMLSTTTTTTTTTTTIPISTESTEEQPESQVFSVADLTAQIAVAQSELDAASHTNAQLTTALQQALLSAEQTPACPVAEQSVTLLVADFRLFGVDVPLMHVVGGVAVAVLLTIVATALFCHLRSVSQLRSLRLHLQDLSSELDEVVFEKETAAENVAILETELQRKVKQLADAQRHHQSAAAAGNGASTPVSESPRIRAVLQQNNNTNQMYNNNTHNQNGQQQSGAPTPDSLPPPPRQLVERFLQERGAIAVEHEQVQAWLEMEGAYGQLQREAVQLRAAVDGRGGGDDTATDAHGEDLQMRLDELTEALEEQTHAARTAKMALKTAAGVMNDDDDLLLDEEISPTTSL